MVAMLTYLYENWVSESSGGFYEFIVHAMYILEFAYHMHSYGSACIHNL